MGHGGALWQNVVQWRGEGEGNGKPLQCSCLRTSWTVWKAKWYNTKSELPKSVGAQYDTGESREIAPEGMKMLSQSRKKKKKTHSVVDVSGGESKVWCCKEQYCIGTWNVRSMNQGKLEVIQQGMARVNIDILGFSELKWSRMGEFNLDDHCIYYLGKNPLEEMEYPS